MKIHEYQAKEILRRYGVKTPRGQVTDTAAEAGTICAQFGGKCVVKAQIHAGGRGKGGGVKLAGSRSEAEELAKQILGMQLVTKQTGSEGKKVEKIFVEEAVDIARELYLSVTLDRALGKPVVMDVLAKVVRRFDVVAIQEVRSKDQTVVPQFTQMVNAAGARYDYVLGPRLGRTVSKEQYAFLYDTSRVALDPQSIYTVSDPDNLLHREPLVATFRQNHAFGQNHFIAFEVVRRVPSSPEAGAGEKIDIRVGGKTSRAGLESPGVGCQYSAIRHFDPNATFKPRIPSLDVEARAIRDQNRPRFLISIKLQPYSFDLVPT